MEMFNMSYFLKNSGENIMSVYILFWLLKMNCFYVDMFVFKNCNE